MVRDMALKTMLHLMQENIKNNDAWLKLYQRQDEMIVWKGDTNGR